MLTGGALVKAAPPVQPNSTICLLLSVHWTLTNASSWRAASQVLLPHPPLTLQPGDCLSACPPLLPFPRRPHNILRQERELNLGKVDYQPNPNESKFGWGSMLFYLDHCLLSR